jgi:hypothetical protein
MHWTTRHKAENKAAWPARIRGIVFDHLCRGGLDTGPDLLRIQAIGVKLRSGMDSDQPMVLPNGVFERLKIHCWLLYLS